ncbi:MAG: response regulator [Alphaproteobacteria bacterium]|nr:response regulator [Alphaproteobacteria bacterium]
MTPLEGLRVLIVEDEAPIAMMIEDMLQEMGCVVAGAAANVEDALRQVENGAFGFAFLDLNLGGRSAEGVADALAAKQIPFAIGSGYGRSGLPAHLQGRPVLQKPFLSAELERAMREALGAD